MASTFAEVLLPSASSSSRARADRTARRMATPKTAAKPRGRRGVVVTANSTLATSIARDAADLDVQPLVGKHPLDAFWAIADDDVGVAFIDRAYVGQDLRAWLAALDEEYPHVLQVILPGR
jgi:hypothetical protein